RAPAAPRPRSPSAPRCAPRPPRPAPSSPADASAAGAAREHRRRSVVSSSTPPGAVRSGQSRRVGAGTSRPYGAGTSRSARKYTRGKGPVKVRYERPQGLFAVEMRGFRVAHLDAARGKVLLPSAGHRRGRLRVRGQLTGESRLEARVDQY